MGKPKEVKASKATQEKIEFEEILGEAHDGEDYKLLMKDGSVRQVPKVLVRNKTILSWQQLQK